MNIKKVIIIVAVLMIITIITVILLLFNHRNETNNNVPSEEYIATPATEEDPIEINENLAEVTVRNNFYAVKNCITKFYTYYNAIYNDDNSNLIMDEEAIASLEEIKRQNIEAVYNILDENYKVYKNITLDNLKDKLSSINTNTIDITKMYVTQKDENISVYFVYGYLLDASLKSSEFSMIVNVDMLNRTYTVLLDDYVKKNYSNIEVGNNVEIDYPQEIKSNLYNTFKYQPISDETYITDVFNSFRDNMIYNVDNIYTNLDETYRQKRFPTLQDFKEYAANKVKEFSIMQLSQYQKTKYNNYIQYVCLTNSNKYFIINELSLMNYNFILDTYTIDLPEFVDKYETSDSKMKVALNIQKIEEAINDNDFLYIYNKLDDIFKQNNFSNYKEFKEYLKSRLFDENIFEYKNIEKQGDVYVATIIINETKKMDIIMALSDDTDFYMSFNID